MRIFENADKHNTKCFSCSALRYADELNSINTDNIYKIYSKGSGPYGMYSIHQIEPIVRLMQTDPKRVMFLSDIEHPSMIIEFVDGRLAQMMQIQQSTGSEFRLTVVDSENNAVDYPIESSYFMLFMKQMINFFDTGIIPVPHKDTVNVIAIRAAGLKAAQNPFVWVEV